MLKLILFAILAVAVELGNSELLIAKPYFKPVQTGEEYFYRGPNWRTSPISTSTPHPNHYYHPGQIFYYPAPAPPVVSTTETPTQTPMVVTVRLPTAEENNGYGTGIRITHVTSQAHDDNANTIAGAESEQSFSTENPAGVSNQINTHVQNQIQSPGQVGQGQQPQLHYYYHQVPALGAVAHGHAYHPQGQYSNQAKIRGHQGPGMLESLMSLPSRWNRFARRTMGEYYRIKAMRQAGLIA